ncbi:hypothetical protein Q3G72_001561 [Acer saccharum]|nr:hypothetical protein Q3G72_001561 [Acer saccharum]
MNSEVCNLIPDQRQSAHYKPNIWKFDFLQSLNSKYEEEEYYKSRAEKLKEDVKQLFVEAFEVLSKLELIDSLMKLGLSNLFEEEIREALDTIASMKNIENLCGVEEDLLYATALYFRLLRQHGYEISPEFCKALFVETKWYNEGYTPTLQEYLSNAWISSSGTVLAVHSIFSIMNEPTEEMAHFLDKNQDLVYNSSLIIRLCNDLATSAAELERGDVASSILCYMREANVSEEVARNHIKAMISETWTKNNGQCFSRSPLLQSFVNITTNFARVAHSLYQYEDGFGVQDRDTKKTILSLLVEPMSM